ncbi:MAG TPA: PEP-CTERM sorting domain-containing protein, partial [Terriglobales bacterium]|nr:PEP-CTERM sorting domain-containing protein [Terriglobales bacterium]
GPDGDKYIEAAWLFAQMGTHPTPADAATYNFAVWGLFSQNALNSPGYAATGAANVLPTPDQLVGFNYSHFYVYVPREGTAMLNGQRVNTMPQEYIGFEQTPEPGTLALLGSGLLGLAIKFRRAR